MVPRCPVRGAPAPHCDGVWRWKHYGKKVRKLLRSASASSCLPPASLTPFELPKGSRGRGSPGAGWGQGLRRGGVRGGDIERCQEVSSGTNSRGVAERPGTDRFGCSPVGRKPRRQRPEPASSRPRVANSLTQTKTVWLAHPPSPSRSRVPRGFPRKRNGSFWVKGR